MLILLFQDYNNAIRRLIWRFECWRAEIEAARAEERRKKEFDRDRGYVSRLDCHSWTPEGLLRWERTLKVQAREWEAEKERAVSLSEEKICIVEAHEDSLRYHEKDLGYKALELEEREESVLACERDYNQLVDDVQSEAFKLRKEYCCHHKVVMIFVLL